MRIGIFGGSFDPVHCGHLALARACQEQAGLDEVWFTPAAIQPLKQAGPQATDAQRVEMLHLAIADEPTWRVCTLELERGGFSYTVDTLRAIRADRPGDELYFLLGADALGDVPHWKDPVEVFRLAIPLVVRRTGSSRSELDYLQSVCRAGTVPRFIEMPPVNVSSSDIRRRVAVGTAFDSKVPPSVAEYIETQGLYR